jgi:hypothetical protein
MFLKPAKAFGQLPQIVSIRADRQLARASERILYLLSDRWPASNNCFIGVHHVMKVCTMS